jgi:hypothetical protein
VESVKYAYKIPPGGNRMPTIPLKLPGNGKEITDADSAGVGIR